MNFRNKMIIGAVLVFFCAVQLVPFYLAITSSFKEMSDLSSAWWFPFTSLTLDNYQSAISDGHVLTAIYNSTIVTVSVTVATCLLGALAAYPLARRRTFFNRSIELFSLGVMMVPPLSLLVPLYSLLNEMRLLNTHLGLILPLLCLSLPQAIFLYTQFLRSIPGTLEEAARVDGANRVTAFVRVVLPVMKPVTATVIILTAVNVWNEFALSSYIMTGDRMRTLAPAIASFFGSQGSNVNAAVAASLVGVIPVVIAYLFLQRYFMKGMLAGAEK